MPENLCGNIGCEINISLLSQPKNNYPKIFFSIPKLNPTVLAFPHNI
jgi:hypothetical protein